MERNMSGRGLCVAACAAWLVSCGAQPKTAGTPAVVSPGDPEIPPELPLTPPPAASACDGLVPTPGPFFSATGPGTYSENCLGTADGTGTYVALGHGYPRWWMFDIVPIAGGEPVGSTFVPYPIEPYLAPMESGFQMTMNHEFRVVDELGNEIVREEAPSSTVRVNARGGSVVFFVPPGVPRAPEVQWRTATGAVTASATVAGLYAVVGVGRSGNALVAVSEAGSAPTTTLRWLGPSGPVSDPFPSPGVEWPNVPEGMRLADGSVALWGRGEAVSVVRDGETRLSPAPSWLSGRRYWSIVLVRGGTAHALLPAVVQDSPLVQIEIVAANGESCGTVVLPSVAHTRDVNIGRDGTVIVGGMGASYDPRVADECEWRWWPGLFR
ncbi:hypothetical protein [Anaeromyxobacter sp. Fw109-5]|uniref:hypothetical protein n=1 Tax=Anaeromyxobacter sp. (strain Fw109-5) TaxID=404589 RepID=UPI000326A20A|nr:hypothetical protein [Anaeromyxobacter sp. Fw109-5]